MKCPKCDNKTGIVSTRKGDDLLQHMGREVSNLYCDKNVVFRRHKCLTCKYTFKTIEILYEGENK